MAFIENDTASQERFNLLLLEPGEIYFEDFSVYYYPGCKNDADAEKRGQRGHLKLCSKSIVFVPKEKQHPIVKFPMKNIQSIDDADSALSMKFLLPGKSLKITADVYVEMKRNNIISPYVFKREKGDHLFTLNYVSIEDCLPQACQLHRASTLLSAEQNTMISAIVLSRQSRVKFNTSWLEDLYETIQLECQGNKITPLVTNPGRIMVTSSRLYFQPFNNVDRVPVIKMKLKDIKKIVCRRFLLKQIGLELFCDERCPHPHLYLALKTPEERDLLYTTIVAQPDICLDEPDQMDMTLRWQSKDISNFEYLMYLNSKADRSFYDLTQYPVLPWIVQDFESATLDLENPATFRDLSKPIGALNPERLERMKERYHDMPEPKFLYGAHYSTPGYVLFFLARMAPEYVLCLQNGKFDQPDRMFNSVYELWQNCLNGAADFKELIPEFYDSEGDFLSNSGITNFGFRQDGRPVGNVDLPPWASSSQDFIDKLRDALESDYVSSHLHDWIDLIFGFKQRGEEAEKADNVFYYMTYEGAVDLDSITDPNERACMEIQIMEFGQVPKQLFTTPHPQRYGPRDLPRTLSTVSGSSSLEFDTGNSAGAVADQLVLQAVDFSHLELKLQFSLHKDAVTDVQQCHDGKCVFSVSQDSLLKMYSLEEQRQLRSITLTGMALSSCIVMPDNKTIVCGAWDNNVYFYSVEFGRVLDCLHAHDDAVSQVLWKNDILLTSSWDSTVKVWQFSPPSNGQGFSTAQYVAQLDHDAGVCSMVMDTDCQILLTGTVDGQICSWDLIHYYQTSQHQMHVGRVNAIALSQDKRQMVSCGEDKYLRVMDWESGTEIFVKDVRDTIKCLVMVGSILLAGTQSGILQVWDIDKAQQVNAYHQHTDAITCLCLSDNYSLLSGSADNSVIVWRPVIS